jgi:hypothetical protein
MIKSNQEIKVVLLRGSIENFQRSTKTHDFVLTQEQHLQIDTTAVAAAVFGMGATGMGLLSMAQNSSEEADWIEFEMDGKKIQGWFWMMPMRNGDAVEVVAVQVADDQYIAYAVKRDGDNILCVYPHAMIGWKAYRRSTFKFFLWFFVAVYTIFGLMICFEARGMNIDAASIFFLILGIGAGGFLIFGLLFLNGLRKMKGFSYIAEAIFKAYGWPDVENIDLRKTSKENRGENFSDNYGLKYFRYK